MPFKNRYNGFCAGEAHRARGGGDHQPPPHSGLCSPSEGALLPSSELDPKPPSPWHWRRAINSQDWHWCNSIPCNLNLISVPEAPMSSSCVLCKPSCTFTNKPLFQKRYNGHDMTKSEYCWSLMTMLGIILCVFNSCHKTFYKEGLSDAHPVEIFLTGPKTVSGSYFLHCRCLCFHCLCVFKDK